MNVHVPEKKIRVFLLDDHELVRRGLRDYLQDEGDLQVVGEGGCSEGAVQEICELVPDVAVIDVRLPDGNGIEVCREIRSACPETACLILTSYSDDRAMLDSIVAGAAGYVLKEQRTAEVVDAIRALARGESLFEPDAAERAFEEISRQAGRTGELSPQEERILDLIGRGLTNREIGDELHLAEQTVKNYVSRILSKMGFERRVQAVLYASRRSPGGS